MKKIKGKIVAIVILAVLNIAGICFLLFFSSNNDVQETLTPNSKAEDNKTEKSENSEYQKNKDINKDYIGDIVFESGLINLPFVQAQGTLSDYEFYAYEGQKVVNYNGGCEGGECTLNDVYLRKDWKTGNYELGGSVFMDYRNSLNDQNIIIYGHLFPRYLDAERELFFTPLEKLLKQAGYEANKYVDLILENETRRYEIVHVYIFDTINDQDYEDLQFFRTNYDYDYDGILDAGYLSTYEKNMKIRELYGTGLSLSETDDTLTLQTCVDGSDSKVEIVVAKLIKGE